jgi:hypothetical protein
MESKLPLKETTGANDAEDLEGLSGSADPRQYLPGVLSLISAAGEKEPREELWDSPRGSQQ